MDKNCSLNFAKILFFLIDPIEIPYKFFDTKVVRLTKRGVAMALHRSFEATRERVSDAGKALLGRMFFMKLWRSEAF